MDERRELVSDRRSDSTEAHKDRDRMIMNQRDCHHHHLEQPTKTQTNVHQALVLSREAVNASIDGSVEKWYHKYMAFNESGASCLVRSLRLLA